MNGSNGGNYTRLNKLKLSLEAWSQIVFKNGNQFKLTFGVL